MISKIVTEQMTVPGFGLIKSQNYLKNGISDQLIN